MRIPGFERKSWKNKKEGDTSFSEAEWKSRLSFQGERISTNNDEKIRGERTPAKETAGFCTTEEGEVTG